MCKANQLTGFYKMATLAFNELIFGAKTDDYHKEDFIVFIETLQSGNKKCSRPTFTCLNSTIETLEK